MIREFNPKTLPLVAIMQHQTERNYKMPRFTTQPQISADRLILASLANLESIALSTLQMESVEPMIATRKMLRTLASLIPAEAKGRSEKAEINSPVVLVLRTLRPTRTTRTSDTNSQAFIPHNPRQAKKEIESNPLQWKPLRRRNPNV